MQSQRYAIHAVQAQNRLDYRDMHQAPSVMSYKAHVSQLATAKTEK